MTFDAINDKSNHIQHICNAHTAGYKPKPQVPYKLNSIDHRKFAFENNFISENYKRLIVGYHYIGANEIG